MGSSTGEIALTFNPDHSLGAGQSFSYVGEVVVARDVNVLAFQGLHEAGHPHLPRGICEFVIQSVRS